MKFIMIVLSVIIGYALADFFLEKDYPADCPSWGCRIDDCIFSDEYVPAVVDRSKENENRIFNAVCEDQPYRSERWLDLYCYLCQVFSCQNMHTRTKLCIAY